MKSTKIKRNFLEPIQNGDKSKFITGLFHKTKSLCQETNCNAPFGLFYLMKCEHFNHTCTLQEDKKYVDCLFC